MIDITIADLQSLFRQYLRDLDFSDAPNILKKKMRSTPLK